MFFWLSCATLLGLVLASSVKAETEAETTSDNSTSENTAAETAPSDDPYGINKKPKVSEGIGVDDHIGQFVSGDQGFDDHNNNHVRFGHFFDGSQPVMLSFNYSNLSLIHI